jgi:ATPase subunit of ABC transporter with duplicated ATPase domains
LPSLHFTNVSFSYSDSVVLLVDVDLQLDPGWYGVVGANGAGKTTLLRMAAGELVPEIGSVSWHPPDGALAYCPQEVGACSADVRALACASHRRARRLMGELCLVPEELERWDTLSPGERKRWQVAAALAEDPVVLLLDEPTNHLDREARDLLVRSLQRFSGVGLVVSHDRALLEELTTGTIRVHERSATWHRGPYSSARETWEREDRERRDSYAKLRNEQKKLERRLRDRQQKKSQSMAALRTSKHMHGKSPKDNAARNAFKASRRRSKDVSLGKEVRQTHHKLERVGGELSTFRFEKDLGRDFFVDFVPAPTRTIAALDHAVVCAGSHPVLDDVTVTIARDSRIRVAGPNGAGKTTLLRALIDASRLPRERLLYLPQELEPGEEIALLERLRALGPDVRGKVLGMVAALGVAPEPLLASRRPSPGEARKLALALGLGTQVWALVLDEPTNHLDLPSIERIEAALEHYPGALVVVTHDDAFARHCTRATWQLNDGEVCVG